MSRIVKAAAVQFSPVLCSREAAVATLVEKIGGAGARGSHLQASSRR